jgi:hypothetical protein
LNQPKSFSAVPLLLVCLLFLLFSLYFAFLRITFTTLNKISLQEFVFYPLVQFRDEPCGGEALVMAQESQIAADASPSHVGGGHLACSLGDSE